MMDRAERELFERSLDDATRRHSGGALDADLHALGWHEALASDPHAAIASLFELQGRHLTSSSALGDVLRHALDLDAGEAEAEIGIVGPVFGGWLPPAAIAGTGATIAGLASATSMDRPRALAVAEQGDKTVALVVDTSSLTIRPRPGIDPQLGLVEVAGASVEIRGEPDPVRWDAAVARCRLALAHELQGASRFMLDAARTHALERVQFGQPISAFQAVRHRLAETLIAIETTEAMLDAAWADPSPLNASMAKALAGRGARAAARHCQQVMAGIGFTTEHPFHRAVKRVLVLDHLFGASKSLTELLGRDILRAGRLPAPQPL